MSCKYCHDPVLNFQQINSNGDHTKCGRECVRRENMGACIFCNKPNISVGNNGCSSCIEHNLDYEGY